MQTKQAAQPAGKITSILKPLHKLDANTNAITWFEIPVIDMARASMFYEAILDIKMEKMDNQKEEALFFPRLPNTIMAQSGIVSGALVKSERSHPSEEGLLVYLNAYPSIQKVIDRIEPAGGKVILRRTKIPAGYISVFIDTEGNKLALHADE